eukprot:SAG11_NODE_3433_length_2450_cov_1.809017_3_plen_218_part_01
MGVTGQLPHRIFPQFVRIHKPRRRFSLDLLRCRSSINGGQAVSAHPVWGMSDLSCRCGMYPARISSSCNVLAHIRSCLLLSQASPRRSSIEDTVSAAGGVLEEDMEEKCEGEGGGGAEGKSGGGIEDEGECEGGVVEGEGRGGFQDEGGSVEGGAQGEGEDEDTFDGGLGLEQDEIFAAAARFAKSQGQDVGAMSGQRGGGGQLGGRGGGARRASVSF